MNVDNDDSDGIDWVADVEAMSSKFGVRSTVSGFSPERLSIFLQFRLDFLQEELNEALKAKDVEDIVDAMIDLCVVAIGTIEAVGVDVREAWKRVHKANMAKTPGVKPERPNPLGLPDLIKPPGWTAPSHADNVGDLHKLFGESV